MINDKILFFLERIIFSFVLSIPAIFVEHFPLFFPS